VSADALLQTSGLVKRFGGLLATDHVSLAVQSKEVHALIGPNGAGKTTLIGQLTGELIPDEGSVLFAGADVTRESVDSRSRRGLARSYQITQIFKDFTALENVMMSVMAADDQHGARRTGTSWNAWQALHADTPTTEQAWHWLETAGLKASAHIPTAVLAHGEHRQLELAMALALKPRLLVLDEPLAGMSKAESEIMVQLLQGLRGDYPMLLVEHDMTAVFALADTISVLVYGKVIASGRPDEIRNSAEVRNAYLGEEDQAEHV
jgi:branched-chain amino acid transport system ATP-binding protein